MNYSISDYSIRPVIAKGIHDTQPSAIVHHITNRVLVITQQTLKNSPLDTDMMNDCNHNDDKGEEEDSLNDNDATLTPTGIADMIDGKQQIIPHAVDTFMGYQNLDIERMFAATTENGLYTEIREATKGETGWKKLWSDVKKETSDRRFAALAHKAFNNIDRDEDEDIAGKAASFATAMKALTYKKPDSSNEPDESTNAALENSNHSGDSIDEEKGESVVTPSKTKKRNQKNNANETNENAKRLKPETTYYSPMKLQTPSVPGEDQQSK